MRIKMIVWAHLIYWVSQHSIIFIFYVYPAFVQHNYIPFGFLADYAFFYTLYLWIYPKLYERKKVAYHLSLVGLATAGYMTAIYFCWNYLAIFFNGPDSRGWHQVDSMIAITIGYLVSAAGLLAFDYWWKSENHKKALEAETLDTELLFLKSQMNPHFLFNTINNIFALSLQNSRKTTSGLFQLRVLMNYLLEFEKTKKIRVEQEIEFIESYLELNRLRLPEYVQVTFDCHHSATHERQIEPMLLICFIENAFKHGDTFTKDASFYFSLEIDDTELTFVSRNNVVSKRKDTTGGIGINNVKKRLNLLYPAHHQLKIGSTEEDQFEVKLRIPWP